MSPDAAFGLIRKALTFSILNIDPIIQIWQPGNHVAITTAIENIEFMLQKVKYLFKRLSIIKAGSIESAFSDRAKK